MNCSNCGTAIPYDERFCRNCGREEVPLAPTSHAGPETLSLPNAQITEQYHPQPETMRVSSPPFADAKPAPEPQKDRSTLLMPITIASSVIALLSIGVLAYFLFTKDKAPGGAPIPPGQAQQTASPSETSSPTPTPQATVTPTATPTPVATPTPKPTPSNEVPPGARLGYCNDTNVFVRSAPDLKARPVTKLSRGQNIWVIGTSTNYSTWNGITSNWTQVQLYNSSVRGWVFTPFVSYQTG